VLRAVNQEWISENNVLSIVLRDNLHQPQYVEKLEKIVRFMIKEKSLTLEDLDKIWDAQVRALFNVYALSHMHTHIHTPICSALSTLFVSLAEIILLKAGLIWGDVYM